MEYEEPNDNFTFWFLVGVVIFFAVVAFVAWRMNREIVYTRPETPVIQNKTGGDEPPVWECPKEPCKG